jgi:hypothetical protein
VRRYAPRMDAGENDGGPTIAVKVLRLRSKRFRSALALAESWSTGREPSWWPEDTGKVSYRLDGAAYWIGSTRRGEAELVRAVQSIRRVPTESD